MVLGIGEGRIELTLNGSAFSPGQSIAGHCSLSMNESISARELRAEFYGLQKKGKHTVRICEVKQQLGPARVYRTGEGFDFSLPIPPDALPPKINGLLGSIASFLYNLSPPRWFVEVSLDVPMKFDLNARQQVQLVPAVGQPSFSAEQYAKEHGLGGQNAQAKTWGI